MKTLIKSGMAMLATCLIMLFSCKKGDTGPAGPAGTANVIYSNWMDTNPWVASTTSTGSGKKTYYFDIAAPKVTQEIIDKGTVLVYVQFVADPDGPGISKLLPSIYYNFGGANEQYRFQTGLFLNKIRVICDIIPSGIPSTANKLRYLIIPGGVPNARKADYTRMSYEEVCRMLKIEP